MSGRSRVLRAIAEGGYSPSEDAGGETRRVLTQLADDIDRSDNSRTRDAYVVLGLLTLGECWHWCKRWAIKLRLRLKLRWFGLVPALAIAWALIEVAPLAHAIAQAPSDSLIGTVLSRTAIGEWKGDTIRVYCITWHAEIPSRPHVLVVIDAAPADTTHHPICPNPAGGFYPLWVDGPTCPEGKDSPLPERAWIIVRCGPNALSRYRRREYPPKGEQ